MGLFDWFKRDTNFKRYDDAFALTRPALWKALHTAIESARQESKNVWLVVHFTDTFSELQNQLESKGVDYEIVSAPITSNDFDRSELFQQGPVRIVLSDLLPESVTSGSDFSSGQPATPDTTLNDVLAIIVCECHPHYLHNERIAEFAKRIPFRVELGFFMSLDDTVLKSFINETTIRIMKQLGMGEQELVASNMISRRLNTMLKRNAVNFTSDRPASSAEEWIELNSSSA